MVCRECRELFDVCTRVRRREPAGARWADKFARFIRPEIPPPVLRDPSRPLVWRDPSRPLVWREFSLACSASPKHFVEPWQDPGRCPRCGNFMEKGGLPFRLWD